MFLTYYSRLRGLQILDHLKLLSNIFIKRSVRLFSLLRTTLENSTKANIYIHNFQVNAHSHQKYIFYAFEQLHSLHLLQNAIELPKVQLANQQLIFILANSSVITTKIVSIDHTQLCDSTHYIFSPTWFHYQQFSLPQNIKTGCIHIKTGAPPSDGRRAKTSLKENQQKLTAKRLDDSLKHT